MAEIAVEYPELHFDFSLNAHIAWLRAYTNKNPAYGEAVKNRAILIDAEPTGSAS